MLSLAHQYLDQLRLPLRYLQRAMRQEDASLESPCQTIEEFATSTRIGSKQFTELGGELFENIWARLKCSDLLARIISARRGASARVSLCGNRGLRREYRTAGGSAARPPISA